MEIIKVGIEEIHPYPNNPRQNDGAVQAVAESIRQCGYVSPIIVDEDMVILAGHTRYKALVSMGYQQAEVCIARGLSGEQKRKYRILDNKTGEIAEWDAELLAVELNGLDFDDFDFGLVEIQEQQAAALREALDLEDGEQTEEKETGQQCHCPKCGFVFSI